MLRVPMTPPPGCRRSGSQSRIEQGGGLADDLQVTDDPDLHQLVRLEQDRKSTRLNSSHANTSYPVFCLKKIRQPPLLSASSPPHPYTCACHSPSPAANPLRRTNLPPALSLIQPRWHSNSTPTNQ